MRIRSAAAPRRGLDDGTVPLINIGFLLLLFLLVGGELGGADALPIVLPKAEHAQQRHERLPLRIDVAQGNPVSVRINGKAVALAEIPTHLPKPDGRRPAMLRADANLTTERLHVVLNALREAGYVQLRLAVRPANPA